MMATSDVPLHLRKDGYTRAPDSFQVFAEDSPGMVVWMHPNGKTWQVCEPYASKRLSITVAEADFAALEAIAESKHERASDYIARLVAGHVQALRKGAEFRKQKGERASEAVARMMRDK